MTSGRIGRVLIIVGVAAIFGVVGVVWAAYWARNFLRIQGGPPSRAGPALLFFGMGVGAAFGALFATGLIYIWRRLPPRPRAGSH